MGELRRSLLVFEYSLKVLTLADAPPIPYYKTLKFSEVAQLGRKSTANSLRILLESHWTRYGFVVVDLGQLSLSSFNRELNPSHVTAVMKEMKRYDVDPSLAAHHPITIVAVDPASADMFAHSCARSWANAVSGHVRNVGASGIIIDGQHHFHAAQQLGLKSIVARVIPYGTYFFVPRSFWCLSISQGSLVDLYVNDNGDLVRQWAVLENGMHVRVTQESSDGEKLYHALLLTDRSRRDLSSTTNLTLLRVASLDADNDLSTIKPILLKAGKDVGAQLMRVYAHNDVGAGFSNFGFLRHDGIISSLVEAQSTASSITRNLKRADLIRVAKWGFTVRFSPSRSCSSLTLESETSLSRIDSPLGC